MLYVFLLINLASAESYLLEYNLNQEYIWRYSSTNWICQLFTLFFNHLNVVSLNQVDKCHANVNL